MPAPTQTNGTLVILAVDDNGGATAIAYQDDATLTTTRELPDATTKDSNGHEEHLEDAGVISETISVNGKASFTTSGNYKRLYDIIHARKDVAFTFGTNTFQLSGNVGCSQVELGAPMEDGCTWSGDFKVNGASTLEVVS